MTGDETDDTPRTYDNGGHIRDHSGPYRGLDPAQQDLYRRMERLEARDEVREETVVSLTSTRRTWRWLAPVLLSAMLALAGYAVGQISSSAEHVGETKAEIRALGKLIDLLETEVAELRRHAGLDRTPIGITGHVGVNP